MTPEEILSLYDREMRLDPPAEPGTTFERGNGVLRARGSFNCVLWSELSESDACSAIAEQASFFRARGEEVEWKVHGYDGPPDLRERLEKAGFLSDEPETLMVLEAENASIPAPGDAEIRPVEDDAGLAAMAAATSAAFGRDDSPHLEAFRTRLQDPSLRLYVAYVEGRAASAGRLEMPAERSFASLWGGGTVPEFRRRGVYRSLVAARVEEARSRGYRFVTVDARETSRPILERLGFVPLTTVQGWILSPVF